MSFKVYKRYGEPMLVTRVLANSAVMTVGDLVKFRDSTAGATRQATVAGAPAGVAVDFVDRFGNSIFGSIPTRGGATTTGNEASGTVTVDSNNFTSEKVSVVVDISKQTIYSATVTGTIGTTSNSDEMGGWVNTDDQDSVDETTHTVTITDVRTMKNWGQDPDDTTRMLVSIAQSEIWDAPRASVS